MKFREYHSEYKVIKEDLAKQSVFLYRPSVLQVAVAKTLNCNRVHGLTERYKMIANSFNLQVMGYILSCDILRFFNLYHCQISHSGEITVIATNLD